MQINILQNDEDAFLKHHPETIKKPAASAAVSYTHLTLPTKPGG